MKSLLSYIEGRWEDELPDWYWNALMARRIWCEEHFPWYYRWRMNRRHRAAMMEKFGYVPGPGDVVNTCRDMDERIVKVDADDPDMVTTEDGFTCSLWACCDLPLTNSSDDEQ